VKAPASGLDRAIALGLAIAAVLYLFPLRAYGISASDDGWWLAPVLRMRAGEILYRDVWTYYAPLSLHAFAWLFDATGPSFLAARDLMLAEIVASAVLAYAFTRRFAPPSIAWLPAAVYALAPGPWHKSFYAFVSIAFFVLLARAFEMPRARRFAALGAMAGATLATRQDLGIAQLAIAIAAALLPALAPRFPRAAPLALLAATSAGAAAVLGPFAAYYGAHGALPDLVEAVFVRAVAQADAFGSPWATLVSLDAGEGRVVAVLMLMPLIVAACFGLGVLDRLRRNGLDADVALRGALLGYACMTLGQAYHPVLLTRLLQVALVFYVMAAIALADTIASRPARARPLVAAVGGAAHVLWIGSILFVVPRIHPEELYSGSLRMRRYDTPIEVLGDTVLTGWSKVDEFHLVQAFFAAHAPPGEPTVALPFIPLYNVLLDRRSPLRFVADHPQGNFVMTIPQKRVEAERLLASPARYAIGEQYWFAASDPEDPFRDLLATKFHPVRAYRSAILFERGADADTPELVAILRRMTLGTATPADLDALRALASAHPDAPLVWKLRGSLAAGTGAVDEAIDALHRASALDPADAAPLERTVPLLLQAGRTAEAATDLERARSLRDSPVLRDLAARLATTRGG